VAETLAGCLGPQATKLVPLEATRPGLLAEGGHLVLLYPIHGFNPPRNVDRFVRHLAPSLFEAVSIIAVGCADHWVNHAASRRLRRSLMAKGYAVVADEIVAMPLTFIMAFLDEMARGLITEADARMAHVAASLEAKPGVPQPMAWKSRIVSFVGRLESPASRLFGLELRASDRCTACGTCRSRCPQGNVRRGRDGKPRFGFDCLMCMRCIYGCPANAIAPRFSKFIPIRGGYSLSRYSDAERRSS